MTTARRHDDPEESDGHLERRTGSGRPWWVDSALVLGPVAVIAIVLSTGPTVRGWIWNSSGNGQSESASEQRTIRIQRNNEFSAHMAQTERISGFIEDLLRQQKENIVLQRRICRNTAKTEFQREECDR